MSTIDLTGALGVWALCVQDLNAAALGFGLAMNRGAMRP